MNDISPPDISPQHIRRAAQGDQAAFRLIVEHHSRAMFRLAFRLTQNEAQAEEVVQDTFMKVYRKLKDFKQDSSLRTWIHRITVNTAMDHLRRKRHLEVATETGELPEVAPEPAGLCAAEQQEIQERTQKLLQQLSPIERAALSLRHFEGHSIHEIAHALELGESACKQAIFRAVKKLRLALEPWS